MVLLGKSVLNPWGGKTNNQLFMSLLKLWNFGIYYVSFAFSKFTFMRAKNPSKYYIHYT